MPEALNSIGKTPDSASQVYSLFCFKGVFIQSLMTALVMSRTSISHGVIFSYFIPILSITFALEEYAPILITKTAVIFNLKSFRIFLSMISHQNTYLTSAVIFL
jgi:hypothetical protein